jgi:hypothetical protein
MTSASTVNVTGTFTNSPTGAVIVTGGNANGVNGLLNVSGAAPPTATGEYVLCGSMAQSLECSLGVGIGGNVAVLPREPSAPPSRAAWRDRRERPGDLQVRAGGRACGA